MNHHNLDENESCQYERKLDSPNERMCYVVMPSNCTDLQKSVDFPGLQISSQPCHGKSYSQFNCKYYDKNR